LVNNVSMKPDVYIIGASGFGREVESWVSQSEGFNKSYLIKGYIDIDPGALEGYPSDYSIVGNDDYSFKSSDFAILAIADPLKKKDIVNRLKDKVKFLTFIADTAFIGKYVNIGEGSIIGPNCVLTTNIEIGKFVSIIIGTIIGHDSVISDFSSVMVNVEINGKVYIGEKTYIGSNSNLIPGVKIGPGSKIGAGSIVVNDFPEGSFVYGNPARNYSGVIKPKY
jgi:sugar O-acyltransferase (sialic acid O-acetyltransferase NeuD family)